MSKAFERLKNLDFKNLNAQTFNQNPGEDGTSNDAASVRDFPFPQLFPPFTYFGGKRKIARAVWQRFDDGVPNYIEPFAGGLAVLLGRNMAGCRNFRPYHELVNDSNGLLVNFWRAVQFGDIEKLVQLGDYPSQEKELILWREELFKNAAALHANLQKLDFYDLELAGRTLYVLRNWIGGGALDAEINVEQKMPRAKRSGWQGGSAKFHLDFIKARLKHVITYCNDWNVVFSDGWERPLASRTQTTNSGTTAVFLDPPYLDYTGVYEKYPALAELSKNAAEAARAWAIERTGDEKFRIAYCGYRYQHDQYFPASWQRFAWKGAGYANQGDKAAAENAKEEMIWFSPSCI